MNYGSKYKNNTKLWEKLKLLDGNIDVSHCHLGLGHYFLE
jgi:hypothetical protein